MKPSETGLSSAYTQDAHVRLAAIGALRRLPLDGEALAYHADAIERLALRDDVMEVRQAADLCWRVHWRREREVQPAVGRENTGESRI